MLEVLAEGGSSKPGDGTLGGAVRGEGIKKYSFEGKSGGASSFGPSSSLGFLNLFAAFLGVCFSFSRLGSFFGPLGYGRVEGSG